MTDEVLYAKLRKGLDDAEKGRLQDAESVFTEFMKEHQ